jgi:hypothetical protein
MVFCLFSKAHTRSLPELKIGGAKGSTSPVLFRLWLRRFSIQAEVVGCRFLQVAASCFGYAQQPLACGYEIFAFQAIR